MPSKQPLSFYWQRIKRGAALVTAGGGWSVQLPDVIQRNLRWYFMDGVFASSQEAINLTFLTLFVLALGASKAQIGLMTSLASLSAVILLIPGAILAERVPQRKWLVIASGGGISRLMLLGLALLPFIAQGPTAVTLAIFFRVVMDGFNNLSLPAWTSLTADIVPLSWRGRYFGNRNMVMSIANMLVTFVAGLIITHALTPLAGYQSVYGLALLFGVCASFCFANLKETKQPPTLSSIVAYQPASLIRALKEDANFRNFCVSQMIWNFSLNIAGPFFAVYQVEQLKATPAIVGVLSIVSSLAALPALRIFGSLNDRLGAYRVALLSGLLIPLVPVLWIFTSSPWHPLPLNLLAGFLWAGYGLASFNLLLGLSTPETLARYSALFQIAVMISAAIGAAVGGLIVQQWGFAAIFIVSGIGRVVGLLHLWRFVKPQAQATP